MRKIFLMSSVLFVAPFTFGESGEVSAQCVATTDCASLGYTEASCPNGGIKCPFGNSWNCGNFTNEKCLALGFKYNCSGSNEISGTGEDCNGKYAQCNCKNGYSWIKEQCQLQTITCEIGSIYYSDKTCSSSVINGKTPLGIVVYVDGKGHGQALVKERATTNWAGDYTLAISDKRASETDIPTMTNYQEADAIKDFDSCGNTKKMIAFANENLQKSDNWNNYFPLAAEVKDTEWCIPAAGILNSIYNNLSKINASLLSIGGSTIQFHNSYGTGDVYWSSTEASSSQAWSLYFSYTTITAGSLRAWNKYSNGYDQGRGIFVIEF